MPAIILTEIKQALTNMGGNWSENNNLWSYSAIIAERKAFLSKKKLAYSMKIRADDIAKVVHFSEMLTESGSGLSSGGGFDDRGSSGFGFKTESYNTFRGARQGTIAEQSVLFGKEYSYQFDFKTIRELVKEIVERNGYLFNYQILPIK